MLIYDIEIKRGIPPTNAHERIEGIEYCNGWEDHAAMGVACVGVYDYCADKYRVFGEAELADFQQLADAHDVAIGYNNIRFDNSVLKANNVVIPPQKSYDILAEIYSVLGSFRKGYRLDDVAKANFPNAAKTGNGADAPIWWQQGFQTRVIDYCLNDVRLTKMIFDKIIRFGYIKDPTAPGEVLRLRRP